MLHFVLELKIRAYERQLITWAANPQNPPQGEQGLGFELLVWQMLIPLLPDYNVELTCGDLEFASEGPNGDIIVSKSEGDRQVAAAIFNTKIKKMGRYNMHPLLNCSVIPIRGSDVTYRSVNDLLVTFATDSDPVLFAQTYAYSDEADPLKSYLKTQQFLSPFA